MTNETHPFLINVSETPARRVINGNADLCIGMHYVYICEHKNEYANMDIKIC